MKARAIIYFCALSLSSTFYINAHAYEAATTHPGITGAAALKSSLHKILNAYGLRYGLFSSLAISQKSMDKKSFDQLLGGLKRLDPSRGYCPNQKNEQYAIGWLMAGSVLADMIPGPAYKNHFFDPIQKTGLNKKHTTTGLFVDLFGTVDSSNKMRKIFLQPGDNVAEPALAWLLSLQNSFSVQSFYNNFAASVENELPKDRKHHLALALMSLGNILHILQDMASPTHTRNDFAVGHMQKLSESLFDRGSAYERFVSIIYGHLGLPAYKGKPISHAHLIDFFSTTNWQGLADITNKSHFSPGTIPLPTVVSSRTNALDLQKTLNKKLPFSEPSIGKIDLKCALKKTCYLSGTHGPLLGYRIDFSNIKSEFDPVHLQFFLDKNCFYATAQHLLPLAEGYSIGLVEYFFRARILLTKENEYLLIHNNGIPLSSGTIKIIWQAKNKNRQLLQEIQLSSKSETGAILAKFPIAKIPSNAKMLIVLWEGEDLYNEQAIAVAIYRTDLNLTTLSK